ncbi:MAG: hypothetical protein KME45_09695 [Stenomitos rutilans HA7619-LM2]|nr:hypothetical protein [Stenomitos rutilans HA7619-LM2]
MRSSDLNPGTPDLSWFCCYPPLRNRLKTPVNHLACVGTSATLGSHASQEDVLNYASTIFQVGLTHLPPIPQCWGL